MQPNFTISSETGRSFMPTERQTDGACGRVSLERHKLEIKKFAHTKKHKKYLPQDCHVYAVALHGWGNDRDVYADEAAAWRMLAYAGVCWRMLAYADVC